MTKGVKRLYEQFQPNNYKLVLSLDKKSMSFSGSVVVEGRKVGRPSQRITLHQKDLKVTHAKLTKKDKVATKALEVSRISIQKGFDELRLHSAEILYPGEYHIELQFRGKITKAMQGVYPCFYKHDGQEKIILATQFESHHAREVFPCIDEPEAKATFELSLLTPKGEVALSNTPISSQNTTGSSTTTQFEVTPKMSPYLLAFVVGDLHSASTKTKTGVEVKSWSSVASPKSHLKYSADEAAKFLDFFAEYFGVPYPLKKLDQVALPDFDAGAMENWGLVTYREVALLIDPINRSISSEQFVSMVIAHELSHQWFGNLVTMKWWDDLWLNESFAGLMEHLANNELHPDWQQWELYTMQDIPTITARDVYKNIQPVAVEVNDPELIETLFDGAIVYAKGARLIKMLREYIGEEAFIKGLKNYFNKHKYSNTTRSDLWEALAEASGKELKHFMLAWLAQPGMPVIHVSQTDKSLKLTQERFLLDDKSDDATWPIPLLANKPLRSDLLDEKSAEVTLGSSDWVLLNQNASGQFITHYTEPGHRDYLGRAISRRSISTEARINLFNDLYMLARHGDAPLTDSLDLITQCAGEPRDSVWGVIVRSIGAASQLTEGDLASENAIKALKIRLAKSWYDKLGWEDKAADDPNTKQLRRTMVGLMVSGEDKKAIEKAKSYYQKHQKLDDIPAELRSLILSAVVRHGQPTEVDRLIGEYPKASSDIQQDISAGLSSTKSPKVALSILDKALGPSGFVRDQDIMRWLAMFLRNHHIRSETWDYMVKNWAWLEEALSGSKYFDYLPTYCASVINTPVWEMKYHKLFEPKKRIKVLAHNIELGYADIAARVAWRKRDETKAKQWLRRSVG